MNMLFCLEFRKRRYKIGKRAFVTCLLLSTFCILIHMMWGRSSSPQSTGQTDDEGEQNFLLHGKLKEMELPEDVLNMHFANIQKPSHQELKKKPHDPKSQSSALEKMKKNMNMESDRARKELEKLPKPRNIIKEAIGPVSKLNANDMPHLEKGGTKLVVVASPHTGFSLLNPYLSEDNGWFQHMNPPAEADVIVNLLNCVLRPEIVDQFEALVSKTRFGDSNYFKKSCLLQSGVICSDPLSYESFCTKFTNQVVRVSRVGIIEDILEYDKTLKVIFLVRDPRGVLGRNGGIEKANKSCKNMSDDLLKARELKSKYPSQFQIKRYETLASNPHNEISKLSEELQLGLNQNSNILTEAKEGWSLDKNSEQKVNKWKSKLSMPDLQKIENKCSDLLSKLEYPLMSQGVN